MPNNSKNTSGKTFNDRPKWFNENCYNAMKDFKNSRYIFNINKTAEIRTAFVKMRTKYNRIRQKAKYNYKKKEGTLRKYSEITMEIIKKNEIKNQNIQITISV